MQHSPYLQRCLQLAQMGGTHVGPNPQVGAVLVHKNRIIGEGFHAYYGGPHAEVMAVEKVSDPSLLPEATLYVSLEPCNHHGKTPPCTDLILRNKIPRVVIGCLDPDPRVSGGGVARLREHGVDVQLAENTMDFVYPNRAFFVNQQCKRPYITLKWAQTQNGLIAGKNEQGQDMPVAITSFESNTLVHRLRSDHQGIMIGRRTAEIDNPSLTNRHYYGDNPQRIILDPYLKLPAELKVFHDRQAATLVLNRSFTGKKEGVNYLHLDPWPDLPGVMKALYEESQVYSILVEGGSQLLQQFIDSELYDEVYCFQGPMSLEQGKKAPVLPPTFSFEAQCKLGPDLLFHHQAKHFHFLPGNEADSPDSVPLS